MSLYEVREGCFGGNVMYLGWLPRGDASLGIPPNSRRSSSMWLTDCWVTLSSVWTPNCSARGRRQPSDHYLQRTRQATITGDCITSVAFPPSSGAYLLSLCIWGSEMVACIYCCWPIVCHGCVLFKKRFSDDRIDILYYMLKHCEAVTRDSRCT
jgi:hypothetical protein